MLPVLIACSETGFTLAPPDVVHPRPISDGRCELSEHPARRVARPPSCPGEPTVVAPWEVVVEWQWRDPVGEGTLSTPVVAHLDDDDGDGRAGSPGDTPEIAIISLSGQLVVLDGAEGSVRWELPGFEREGHVAMADVDGDGAVELLAPGDDRRLVCLDGTGAVEWRSELDYAAFTQVILPTDLDGDGEAEVLVHSGVVRGRDGLHRMSLVGGDVSETAAVAADLDLDGREEILYSNRILRHDGLVLFELEEARHNDAVYAATVDLDADPRGETVWHFADQLWFVDDDGTVLTTLDTSSGHVSGGPPSVADFDGDGDLEIVVPAQDALLLVELDGSLVWSVPIVDVSSAAAASGFDLDGDGAYEVLYADERRFTIRDGRTGEVRFEESRHGSLTSVEYPVVADVDGDGAAEILLASSSGTWRGVTVLGHAGEGWPSTGSTWSAHDHPQSGSDAHGVLPGPDAVTWLEHGLVRARPATSPEPLRARLRPAEACVTTCERGAVASRSFRIDNLGTEALTGPLQLTVRRPDGQMVTSLPLSDLPAPGEATATLRLDVPLHAFEDGPLTVHLDGAPEPVCDSDVHHLTWEDPCASP